MTYDSVISFSLIMVIFLTVLIAATINYNGGFSFEIFFQGFCFPVGRDGVDYCDLSMGVR